MFRDLAFQWNLIFISTNVLHIAIKLVTNSYYYFTLHNFARNSLVFYVWHDIMIWNKVIFHFFLLSFKFILNKIIVFNSLSTARAGKGCVWNLLNKISSFLSIRRKSRFKAQSKPIAATSHVWCKGWNRAGFRGNT